MQSLLSDSNYCGFDIRCPPSPTGWNPYDEGGGGFGWPDYYENTGPIEGLLPGDLIEMHCFSRATCQQRPQFICRASC